MTSVIGIRVAPGMEWRAGMRSVALYLLDIVFSVCTLPLTHVFR